MGEKRKQILYFGRDPTRFLGEGDLTHLPLVETVARPYQEVAPFFASLPEATHLLFTSRVAVSYFAAYARKAEISWEDLCEKTFFSVGEATNQALLDENLPSSEIAKEACGEGVVSSLSQHDLSEATLFYPHSSQARPLIRDYLERRRVSHIAFPLYDTVPREVPLPDLSPFDEIIFTSPSTVAAFVALAKERLPHHKCRPIGPITASALASYLATSPSFK
ncbi:MAG: hypothetical protein K940chlam9_00804 [Chlamydiae bacterium]|nr:hypothetical protein [Chlamydiota bacterium]